MKNRSKPTIGIIGGTGKMGQWLVHFFEEQGLPVLIASRKTPLTPLKLAKKADIVIVSVPIAATQKVIKNIAPQMPKDSLLTDVTSFKVMPLEAMKGAPCATLGMHPLFGPSANRSMGLKIVFCRQKDNHYVTFLKNLFTETGMEVISLTPEEHDYQMAYIQAFTHTVNLLYAKIIFENKNMPENKLATPVFNLQTLVMGRVFYQDLKFISDIQFYNPYFLPVLEAFVEQAQKLETIIEKQDVTGFTQMFKKEQILAKNFASFATLKTNTVLSMASDIALSIPVKVKKITLPKNLKIAYLGPEGTFSHQAVKNVFTKNGYLLMPCDTLYDVFAIVAQSKSAIGIVPAENSLEGPVHATLDYLADFALSVAGSFTQPIHHQLLTEEKQLNGIKTVISHPQALAQCRKWLKKNLPHAKIISASSTTSDIKPGKKGYAYISSQEAAKTYNLPILKNQIEDNPTNITRFYIIATERLEFDNVRKNHSLLFLTVHNRVGILRDILNVFAKHSLNLTKLESRPSHSKTWDYHFFVEVKSAINDRSLKNALAALASYCPIIRILGQT
ncbi:prephenate dehydratase [Candidatus Microgenomates bacterium]|nr:prephenate dehydratase [Candidatus Microgenomates bacterium]